MGLIRPKDHFLTLAPRTRTPGQLGNAVPARELVIGSDGMMPHEIADLRLRYIDTYGLPEILATTPVANNLPSATVTKRKTPKIKEPRQGFLDRPMTLRRSWKIKAMLFSPALLLGVGALADKYTGGAVMMTTVDASVSAADYAYRHIAGEVNVENAIEWGVAIAQPLKFLHTDPAGLWAKNEAALEARHKYPGDDAKAKEAVLPVLFKVDYKSFIANYTLRNAISLRNYKDLSTDERGLMLARGLMRDVHQSFEAASELQGLTLTDQDILEFFFEHRNDVLRRMPPDVRKGLVHMINDMQRAKRGLPPLPTKPLELQDWQKRALEEAAAAEMGPPESPAERQRRDAEMARALREQEEAARPKTLGELMREQRQHRATPSRTTPAITAARPTPPRSKGQLREKMHTATRRVQATAAKAAPSPWQAAWCKTKSYVVAVRMDKCLLGQ